MDISFNRHKLIYFCIIATLTSLVSILTGPLHEVYVDISVSPPENVRRTDFSWITVNEWFMTQAYIIMSHDILKDVTSKIGEERLKQVISAQRLDAADIIRISAGAKENPFELEEAIGQIAEIYLKRVNKPEEAKKLPKEPEKKAEVKFNQVTYQRELDLLSIDRQNLENEINNIEGHLKTQEDNLKEVQDNQAKINDLAGHIANIDSQLSGKKQRLTSLRTTYADAWPEVAKLKQEVDMLEEEKGKYSQELTVESGILHKNEEKKNKLNISIRNDKEAIDNRQKELTGINNRIKEITELITAKEEEAKKKEEAPKTEVTSEKKEEQGYILNPPVINFLPELWVRLFFGFLSGCLIWYIAYLILRKTNSSLPTISE